MVGQGESFQPLSSLPIFYDTLYGFHADQLDVVYGPWNPKYAAHIFKVTVAVDMLGNIVWICPLAPGTSADVLIWDGYGLSRT